MRTFSKNTFYSVKITLFFIVTNCNTISSQKVSAYAFIPYYNKLRKKKKKKEKSLMI